MSKIKKTALFLSILILSIFILACGGEKNAETPENTQDPQNQNNPGENRDESDSAQTAANYDYLPDVDYGGRDFMIMTRDGGWDTCHHIEEFVVEEQIGEVINDAVYKRNLIVEEKFNIKIKIMLTDERANDMPAIIKRMVKSGADDVDLVCAHQVYIGQTAPEGNFLNWFDVPHVNFDQPWWVSDANRELSVDGKTFFVISELPYELLDYTYCVYFNKRLVSDYGLENPYSMVNGGKWTIDYLMKTVRDIYVDIDNDGKRSMDDFYGFASNTYSAGNTFIWSLGAKVMEKDNEGRPQLVMNNQHTADMVDKLYTLYFDTPGSYGLNKTVEKTIEWPYVTAQMFKNGQVIFNTGMFCDALVRFKDMTDDYGIIPYPKWNEAQSDYYTMIDGHGPLLAILQTEQDIEMVGIITEALSAESYNLVTPAYYEVALKIKYSRDEESVQMLDLIKSGIKYDFGYIYDGWQGVAFGLQEMFAGQKKDFASYYEKKERSALKYYNKIIDMYYEFGG
ncbi:MAG: hypothetical protein FWD23_05075 [Oscillospiraceae bacterium]|nr:hypothetical protein [Oscillospiraceae bacterium]